MSAHTPGPWRLGSPGIGVGVQGADGTWVVTNVGGTGGYTLRPDGTHDDSGEANARLIAASPDLLEALRALLEAVEWSSTAMPDAMPLGAWLTASDRMKATLGGARAAIAKAGGK